MIQWLKDRRGSVAATKVEKMELVWEKDLQKF